MNAEVQIVRRDDVRGGSPTIEGTRITVTDIVRMYRMELPGIAGWYEGPPHPKHGFQIAIDTIVGVIRNRLPHLSEEQVVAALTYWHQNEASIAWELDEEDIAGIAARRKYARLP